MVTTVQQPLFVIIDLNKKTIYIMKLRITIPTIVLLSACSSTVDRSVNSLNSSVPYVSVTNFSKSLQCSGNVLHSLKRKSPNLVPKSVLIVLPITDGTTPTNNTTDSALMDQGGTLLESTFSRFIPSTVINLPFQRPPAINKVDILGRTAKSEWITDIAKNYNADKVFVVSGTFSRYDKTSSSGGIGFGTRAKDSAKNSIDISTGKTKKNSIIGLTIKVGNPLTNTLLVSTTLDISVEEQGKNNKFALNINDKNGSVTHEIATVDGIHASQQTLIEAAAYWIIEKIYYKHKKELSLCFGERTVASHRVFDVLSKFRKKSEEEKIQTIQKLLISLEILNKGNLTGRLDSKTNEAIRSFELKYLATAIPHDRRSLDHLYLSLLTNTK